MCPVKHGISNGKAKQELLTSDPRLVELISNWSRRFKDTYFACFSRGHCTRKTQGFAPESVFTCEFKRSRTVTLLYARELLLRTVLLTWWRHDDDMILTWWWWWWPWWWWWWRWWWPWWWHDDDMMMTWWWHDDDMMMTWWTWWTWWKDCPWTFARNSEVFEVNLLW